jgi:hypothetical protein
MVDDFEIDEMIASVTGLPGIGGVKNTKATHLEFQKVSDEIG